MNNWAGTYEPSRRGEANQSTVLKSQAFLFTVAVIEKIRKLLGAIAASDRSLAGTATSDVCLARIFANGDSCPDSDIEQHAKIRSAGTRQLYFALHNANSPPSQWGFAYRTLGRSEAETQEQHSYLRCTPSRWALNCYCRGGRWRSRDTV